MIAGGEDLVDGAVGVHEGTGHDREIVAVVGLVGVEPGEVLLAATRETQSELLLPGGEDVDHETAGADDGVGGAGAGGQADQQQRRIEGDRGQGVDGHPVRGAVVAGGHDGHPGGEPPHGVAHG